MRLLQKITRFMFLQHSEMLESLPILLLRAHCSVSLFQWVFFQSSFPLAIRQRSKHHSSLWVDLSWGSQDPSSLPFLWLELKRELHQVHLQPVGQTQNLQLWHAVSLLWEHLMILCLYGWLDDLSITWKKIQVSKCISNKKMVSQRVLLLRNKLHNLA